MYVSTLGSFTTVIVDKHTGVSELYGFFQIADRKWGTGTMAFGLEK
jgi:hypothetical protein